LKKKRGSDSEDEDMDDESFSDDFSSDDEESLGELEDEWDN